MAMSVPIVGPSKALKYNKPYGHDASRSQWGEYACKARDLDLAAASSLGR